MRLEIISEVNMAPPWGKDNYLINHFMERRARQLNGDLPIDEKSLTIFSLDRVVVMERVLDDSVLGVFEEPDGRVVLRVPCNEDEKNKSKYNDLFIFSPGLLIMVFKYPGEELSDEITNAPYNAISKIVKKHSSKKVKMKNNDLLVGGKKICGNDKIVSNVSGTYQGLALNFYYNDSLFKKLLREHQYTEKGAPITGIFNEIPSFSHIQFITEFIQEMEKSLGENFDGTY